MSSLAAKSGSDAWFVITTERCPHILSRLIGLFAQQNRPIHRVEAIDTGRVVRMTLCVRDLETPRAKILAEKMRQIVMVRTVRLVKK